MLEGEFQLFDTNKLVVFRIGKVKVKKGFAYKRFIE